MSLQRSKCARYLNMVLRLIPTAHEGYDGQHASIVYLAVLALKLMKSPVDAVSIGLYLDALWVGNGYRPSLSYLKETTSATLAATYFCLAIRRELQLPALSDSDKSAILEFVASCQLPSGQFSAAPGDFTEPSLRHTYSAHAIARLLGASPDWMELSAAYIRSCQGFDGGFGDRRFDESHSGYTYCALASLSLSGYLATVDKRVIAYLAKRQTLEGGHNGRPNKPSDVCYSFWNIASLRVLSIDIPEECSAQTIDYILGSGADSHLGGFVKVPGEPADPYHTALGLSALSLLAMPDLAPLDPALTCTYIRNS